MKRQKIKSANHYYQLNNDNNDVDNNFPMQKVAPSRNLQLQTLDVQIQEGDTLQAISLKYDCTVAELKRLNKIEKEIEIHARRILKVPAKPHLLLIETRPIVHKSGQNSPNRNTNVDDSINNSNIKLLTNSNQLNEKLLIASVSSPSVVGSEFTTKKTGPPSSKSTITEDKSTINDIILNSELAANNYKDEQTIVGYDDIHLTESTMKDPLLRNNNNNNNYLDNDTEDADLSIIPQPRAIPIRKNELTCNGSDCDISWICLFVFILALCFAIPIIYILYIAEHPEKYHH